MHVNFHKFYASVCEVKLKKNVFGKKLLHIIQLPEMLLFKLYWGIVFTINTT